MEFLRERAEHDEAQAIYNAERLTEKRINEKWESIVTDKDALIAELETKLAQSLKE